MKMKIIYNHILPFPGYSAMMFFGVILARRKYKPLPSYTVRHEAIHKAQAKEFFGYIPYYFKYLVYSCRYGYRNNPFEVEARLYQSMPGYLDIRNKGEWKRFK